MAWVRRLRLLVAALAIAGAAALSGCAGGGTTVQPAASIPDGTSGMGGTPMAANIIVQVDIFSGRPNPSWTLDATDSAEVRKQIAGLPKTEAPTSSPGLGFRGFVLTGLDPSALAPYDWLSVQGTLIVAHTAYHEIAFADVDHALYSLLRRSAETHVESTILQHIPETGIN
jgi:hypothetical protein